MFNRFEFIGRATKDAELKYTTSGVAVANFSIAVDRDYKNTQGERDTDFFDLTSFRGLAENNIAKYVTKGRLVRVEGKIQPRKYENSEGNTVRVMDFIVEDIKYLDRSKQEQE